MNSTSSFCALSPKLLYLKFFNVLQSIYFFYVNKVLYISIQTATPPSQLITIDLSSSTFRKSSTYNV